MWLAIGIPSIFHYLSSSRNARLVLPILKRVYMCFLSLDKPQELLLHAHRCKCQHTTAVTCIRVMLKDTLTDQCLLLTKL